MMPACISSAVSTPTTETAGRGGRRRRGGDQLHLGAHLAAGGGESVAHLAAGAIAEEPDRIHGLRVPPAVTATRRPQSGEGWDPGAVIWSRPGYSPPASGYPISPRGGRRLPGAALGCPAADPPRPRRSRRASAIRPIPSRPLASRPATGPTKVTPRPRRVSTCPWGRGVLPHRRLHRRRDHERRPAGEGGGGHRIVGEAEGEPGDEVGGGGHGDLQLGPRGEGEVLHAVSRLPALGERGTSTCRTPVGFAEEGRSRRGDRRGSAARAG